MIPKQKSWDSIMANEEIALIFVIRKDIEHIQKKKLEDSTMVLRPGG